jgi:FkbM family methyltransferase
MTSFVSYAQNCEDVLLWRALGHVQGGFYIDVGANDPVEHSVTKAFYERGWHGINIEPLPHFHEAFLEQRPRDVSLPIAAGASEGTITLYDVPAVRGWASPDPKVAAAHQAHGFEIAELQVPMRPLTSVCLEHVGGEIHFLKIDVEGFEGEVLRGMDFVRWRPWVLVIEATLPNSRETSHESWEHLVTGQRYRFAYFDGLNRYYVAEEHPELLPALAVQPNVFDEFITVHLERAWDDIKDMADKLRESEAHAVVLASEAHDALENVDLAEQRRRQAEDLAASANINALRATAVYLERARQDLKELVRKLRESEAHAVVAATEAHDALERAELADQCRREAEQEVARANANAHRTAEWARDMEGELLAIRDSNSWKITRPLRAIGRPIRLLRHPGKLRRLIERLRTNEALRRLIIPLLLRHPALARRVSSSLAAIRQVPAQPAAGGIAVADELKSLPASVRAVLADLQRARGKQAGS